MVNGQRIREAFPTQKEAEAKAAAIRQMIAKEGIGALNVPIALRVEAEKCSNLLKPFPDAAITEAVEYYVKRVLRFRSARQDQTSGPRSRPGHAHQLPRRHRYIFTFGVKHGDCDRNPDKLVDRSSREK